MAKRVLAGRHAQVFKERRACSKLAHGIGFKARRASCAQDPVERLALSADRARLASVAHDSTLRLWDLGLPA